MKTTTPDQPETTRERIVIYDGDCALCSFQMRLVTWMDWFGQFTLMTISDPRTSQVAPGLTREELMAAIHCVNRDGRIHRGARCIRFIGMRMPLAVPLALLLWLPGAIWVAERIYRWVSRNRYLLSRVFGCKEACAVLPPRRREHDPL